MSVIWPGLDLIIQSYHARQIKGGRRYEYPYRIYPPPSDFNRGKFDPFYMDEILAAGKLLRPRAKTGGRIQMDTIELRALIFAIRANLAFVRWCRHLNRSWSLERKTGSLIDDESFSQLKTKSQRVIVSLERHMKRANRILSNSITREQYMLLMNAWTGHLRWMWLHIAYFKPFPSKILGRKTHQQTILDELMQMADRGIRNAGYQPPESQILRRIMRLYVSSARRWREGQFNVEYMMRHRTDFEAKWYLYRFVERRSDLKELSKS
jgi:hypothetical protein